MNFTQIKEFFYDYTLTSIIIAVIFMVVKLVLEKYCSKKIAPSLITFLPILGAILTSLAVDMIINLKAFTITEGTLSSAFLASFLSTLLTAIVKRVIKGKTVSLDKTTLFLEELLSAYSKEKDDEVIELLKQIVENTEITSDNKKEQIDVILKEKFFTLTELEISLVSDVILDFKPEVK